LTFALPLSFRELGPGLVLGLRVIGDGLRVLLVCSLEFLGGGGMLIFIEGLEHLPNRHLIEISLVSV
jgi:hypothetical protein